MEGGTRSFFAVELSRELKEALGTLRDRLDSPRYDVRWVRPGNLHLTLRFLGDMSDQDLETASRAASRAAAQGSPFSLVFRGLGAFPSPGSARIVWVGIEDCPLLVQLESRLSQQLRQAGFPPPDKPFKAHLTLGRVKSPQGREDLRHELERHRDLLLGRQEVPGFSLIKSDLRPSGPVYSALNRFTLLPG